MKPQKTLLVIYRRYLAKYLLSRILKEIAVSMYRLSHRLHSFIKHIPESGTYSLVGLSSTPDNSFTKRTLIAFEEKIDIPAPIFSGYLSTAAIESNVQIEISAPRLEIFKLSDAMVVGKLDIVFNGQVAIHHDLFDAGSHETPSENFGITSINRTTSKIKLYLTIKPSSVNNAVSLLGQCSENYAHWLTETLPKLALLDATGKYKNFPLIVDANLHPNIYESLRLTNKNHRDIIKVGAWNPLRVKNLILVSQPGYERYNHHDIYSKEPPPYINRFSGKALHTLRDSLCSTLESIGNPGNEWVYLARSQKSGNIRHIKNIIEIESMIAAKGIKKITSDSMTFSEQIAACFYAKVIIAPIGASLSNMIFCRPGCKIIALAPYYQDASYFYYSNLSGVLGHELYYVLGPQSDTDLHPIHRNYHIDINNFDETLNKVISSEC
ncbi:glycosyltransferase family 61 protein [Pseudomonas sp. Fl4BN1]|uniref:glycosyltransferase family 61 protein n=1 Tax=Pseudomonas sp. Fl4BN1 TaxID=2697651 RepID=UPI001378C9B9|nr:glycosyltransferase family 61 protein [Pseudomonas sp. Fl4BN1]NBF09323.1 DUF563 domain-containing protein [Pseudomonas sp. Fl4BN1]